MKDTHRQAAASVGDICGAHGYGGAPQVVLVLQGGGALGAYQAGVFQALHEAGIEPDWVIGTSIGAINASLIAGNPAGRRVEALVEFWRRVARRGWWLGDSAWPPVSQTLAYWSTMLGGLPGFFAPNPAAFLGPHVPLGPDRAGYYSVAPLERTLAELVDFSSIGSGRVRLTVGAAHVRTSTMRYFDSRDHAIDVRHILASGALPPAFPPVRIDGELYWDGGILSNTPSEVVFEEDPRRNALIFAVHMWNPVGPEPVTLWDVLHRQKDIQYSSRVASHIARQQQAHRLRHVIGELVRRLPPEERASPEMRELAGHGCLTRMHVMRLLAPRHDSEDQTKDVDFSPAGIERRWAAGYRHAMRAIEAAPWTKPCDPLDGVVLHELADDIGAAPIEPAIAAASAPAERIAIARS